MRQATCLVCLMILATATGVMAEETTIIDAASVVGIRVSSEIDPVDPSWVRCTIDWLQPSEEATVSVLGPASVVATTLPVSSVDSGRWSSDGFPVAPGDRSELLLELAPNDAAQPVMVVVERKGNSVIYQAGVSLAYDGAATKVSAQTSFRVLHEESENGDGAVFIEHLGPKSADQGADLRRRRNQPLDPGRTHRLR